MLGFHQGTASASAGDLPFKAQERMLYLELYTVCGSEFCTATTHALPALQTKGGLWSLVITLAHVLSEKKLADVPYATQHTKY